MSIQMRDEWISLTEYSNKYKISISTLRRRIRNHLIAYRQESGKYFLKNDDPKNQKESFSSLPLEDKKLSGSEELMLQQPGVVGSNKKSHISDSFMLQDKILINKLLDTQKLLQEQITQKDQQIFEQQSQLSDLKTLVALLEKENEQLKSIVYQEKELEDWLSK